MSEAPWEFRDPVSRPFLATIERDGAQVYSARYESASKAWERLADAVGIETYRESMAETEALLRAFGRIVGKVDSASSCGDMLTTLVLSVRLDEDA